MANNTVQTSGYNTLIPYKILPFKGLEYTHCRDYDHISRYKNLRQDIHNPNDKDRLMALETPNPIDSNTEFTYYVVPASHKNRLDIIADKFLGSSSYSWVIAYLNDIEDGYTVLEGQKLRIPKDITALFSNGELLAPVPLTTLNIGSE